MQSFENTVVALVGTAITLAPVIILFLWHRKKRTRSRDSGNVPKMDFFDDWYGGPTLKDTECSDPYSSSLTYDENTNGPSDGDVR
jgi:hypothetical protein